MKEITGGTAPAVLWGEFMKKAHKDIQPQALNYGIENSDSLIETRNKIKEIIQKSKAKPKKNVFETILENFF